jgi:type IV secretory pathway VirB10-like protein
VTRTGTLSRARDEGLRTFAGAAAVLVNASIFVGMGLASLHDEKPDENPEPPSISVELVALPILGKEKEPDALPRIVQPPPPPEPETDAVNLARKKAEEEEEKKKKKDEEKKRELADEKKRLAEEEKQIEAEKKKAEQKERRDREAAMRRALNNVPDPRADEDSPEGFKDGNRDGTSNDPASLLAKSAYINLLSLVLQRQFEVPATLSEAERKRLEAHVFLKPDDTGKLTAEPKLAKSSGNKFFDDAALRAAKKFGAGTPLKLPLPPASEKDLLKVVLRQGITARMKAQ